MPPALHVQRAPPSTTMRRPNSAFRRRAVQAQHAVRHGSQPTARDCSATHVANPVAPVGQLRQRSLGAIQSTLERLANPDVGQAAHRLRSAITDPLAEAHRTAKLGTLCQQPQPLAVTGPTRFQFSANGVEVEIAVGHHPYRTHRARGGIRDDSRAVDASSCQPPIPIANTCIAVNTPTPLLTFGSVTNDTVLPDCSATEAK
jgi:hypothetical protein